MLWYARFPLLSDYHGTLDRLATGQGDCCHFSRYLGSRDVGERPAGSPPGFLRYEFLASVIRWKLQSSTMKSTSADAWRLFGHHHSSVDLCIDQSRIFMSVCADVEQWPTTQRSWWCVLLREIAKARTSACLGCFCIFVQLNRIRIKKLVQKVRVNRRYVSPPLVPPLPPLRGTRSCPQDIFCETSSRLSWIL